MYMYHLVCIMVVGRIQPLQVEETGINQLVFCFCLCTLPAVSQSTADSSTLAPPHQAVY